ncbi:N-ethylammeline chlorohydrolase [Rhodanobacter thiooxydans]|uniref:N-ethylammeline chlorohydrolase n=1 Tax=Rhodanobacter thiooxydans TaxID=416169 RepID=A0A154QH61_9GAMM|nr:TRZ/ATZ family hydrolase [Rhodanobacter thiooxydans]EIM01668.1 N-ethylammeline chlorohydrolase [Rhodanobacter thiooxydans LCS2]KZC23651.1 N-ethylammeline chlorohydrolase [Rhodanobacter thiooxydans]MCW0201683.1 TRZ/ATZ family hydrolase [Rhodanobacter thiooxydans]
MSQMPPQPVDLMIEARWVVPVEPHGVVLDNHAVAVDDGRIVAVLPMAEARAAYAPRERVLLSEHVLIPGLVNSHTHNPMTLLRGLADDLPLMVWLQQHIWPAEAKVLGPEFVRDGVELAVAEMLRGGTTCANENYFFPDVIGATYRKLGFRAVVGLPVIEFPTAWAKSRDEYFERASEVYDSFRGDVLISTAFAPHAPYTVSDESFERIRVLSDQLDIPVHLHTHETAHEVEDEKARSGLRPFQRLQKLGLVNDRLIAVHMTQLTDGEIAACAAAGVSVVHCPESNLKLASGFCPAEKLRAAGVNLALGTDGCASNNDLDMFGEMRTAALLAKAVAGDAAAFDAAFALRAATLNGAKAVGLEARIGSIEVGKQADFAAVRLSDLETQPLFHVISQLVYATGRHQVSDVWIAGKRKLAARELVGMDTAAILERTRAWRERIASA